MKPTTEQDYKQRILKVLLHIQNHLGDAMSLEQLAGIACFSPFHFHRIFRGIVGETVSEHVKRLRLERAARQLRMGEASVAEIASESGYEAIESFTRAFRTMFGEPPGEYRNNQRPLETQPAPSGIHFGSIDKFQPLESIGPPLAVEVEARPPIRVVFMRHTGPYNAVGPTWAGMFQWGMRHGLLGKGFSMIGLCHDDPDVTPEHRIRYDACLELKGDIEVGGDVGIQEIKGGDHAVAIHEGPYEKLGNSYVRLCGEWLRTSGREPRSDPVYEIYLNSPMTVKPEELLTKIFLPLA